MIRKLLLLCCVVMALSGTVQSADDDHTLWLPMMQRARPAIGNGIAHDFVGEPEANQLPLIAAMHTAGIRSIRLPLRWTLIEPAQGQFSWEQTDRAINLLHQHGIDVVGVLTWVPTWANGRSLANTPVGHWPEAYPPTNLNDFTQFAATVAARYQGRIDTYEIFNEPNMDMFWRPAADATAYVPFLCEGYAAVKSADPTATVGMGGLVGNGIEFVRQQRDQKFYLPALYEQGAGDCFDMVTIHPYVHPIETGLGTLQSFFIDETRATMVANGDAHKEIWITEIGWSTTPNAWGKPTVSEAEIAVWIGQLYGELRDVERIYWYNLRDVGLDLNNVEHNFGLLRHDLTQKSAFEAYRRRAVP